MASLIRRRTRSASAATLGRAEHRAVETAGERASWLQVAPLVVVLTLFFGLPMLVVLVVSFFDFDRTDIVPAFILDNYVDLFTLRSDAAALRQLDQVRGDRLGDDAACWASTSPISWCSTSAACCWQIGLFLLCTVPFLTSNIIRMISWIPFLGRNGIFNQALVGAGVVDQPARVPAVLRLRRDRGLRPPVHAVHGGADLQLDGAHRQKPARGGARRRRRPLPRRVRDRAAAVARAASRWARSSWSPW